MRKTIVIILLALMGGLSLSAQKVSLAMMNSEIPCSGYSNESNVYLSITSAHPFRIPDNAGVVYDWYADHEKGIKKWNTRLPNRIVPLPWSGTYHFYVIAKYVNKETLSPFASFKSGVITVDVKACAEKRGPLIPTRQSIPSGNQRRNE